MVENAERTEPEAQERRGGFCEEGGGDVVG